MENNPYCGCSCNYCKEADEIDKHCYYCQDLAVGLVVTAEKIKNFYKGKNHASFQEKK